MIMVAPKPGRGWNIAPTMGSAYPVDLTGGRAGRTGTVSTSSLPPYMWIYALRVEGRSLPEGGCAERPGAGLRAGHLRG